MPAGDDVPEGVIAQVGERTLSGAGLESFADPALAWEVRGRCGFATDFDDSSDDR